MYKVNLKLNNREYILQGLTSGSVKQGINSIDSFSFTILPNDAAFNSIRDFKSLISVYNEKRNKFEFQGRVLYSSDSMDSGGKISKSVVCESFLGYLQDSRQEYVYERNWTGLELLTQLLTVHNSQTEEEKHFKVGTVFTDENIYVGIQRESTWECITKKIIEQIGGEINLRIEDDGMYIDIVKERGVTRATTIELSKNMLSITKESDPSSYITRLIPLGAKLTDSEGNETEERVDITSVNNGLNYIDDEIGISNYGIHIEYEYWDDVNEPAILLTKAKNFLADNNKILQKFRIDALDLALIDIDIDYIDVCNYYPIKNNLLGIDDTLRVITKTIDVVNETSTNVEIGDSFKTLSDLELERNNQLNASIQKVEKIEKDYVVNKDLVDVKNETLTQVSSIIQNSEQIIFVALEEYVTTGNFEEFKQTVSSQFIQTSQDFTMLFNNAMTEINNVNGETQSQFEEIQKYIRFVDGNIILGETGNELTLNIQNDRISFLQNNLEVAYLSNNKLYVTDGEFLNSLQLGNFAFLPRANGNLSFKKVGGN